MCIRDRLQKQRNNSTFFPNAEKMRQNCNHWEVDVLVYDCCKSSKKTISMLHVIMVPCVYDRRHKKTNIMLDAVSLQIRFHHIVILETFSKLFHYLSLYFNAGSDQLTLIGKVIVSQSDYILPVARIKPKHLENASLLFMSRSFH